MVTKLPLRGEINRAKAWGYQARLNDLYVRLVDVGENFLIQTEDVDERSFRVIENPEDVSQASGLLFSRSDFSGGEGLPFAHTAQNNDQSRSRFWDSLHIEITESERGDVPNVKLLRKMVPTFVSSSSSPKIAVTKGTASSIAYVTDGNSVRRSVDLFAWTTETPSPGNPVVDLNATGSRLVAAISGAGVYERTFGLWSQVSNLVDAQRAWMVKDRVISSNGSQLRVSNSPTSHVTILNLGGGESWTDVVDGGEYIIASSSGGTIYFFAVDDDADIIPVGQYSHPNGTVTALTVVFSTLFFTTATPDGSGLNSTVGRLWRGTLVGQPTLADIAIIREWGRTDNRDATPYAMTSTGESVITAILEPGGAFTWKYNLTDTARYRHMDSGQSAYPIVSVGESLGRVLFVDANQQVYVESPSEYEESGYIIGPAGDLFTAEDKVWVEARLGVLSFNQGSVSLYASTDPEDLLDPGSRGWNLIMNRSSELSPESASTPNLRARYIIGKMEINRGTEALTPEAAFFSFRAYLSNPDLVIQLPVMVSDRVERKGVRRHRAFGLGDRIYSKLAEMENGYVELELLRNNEIFRGRLRQVSHVMRVTDKRGRPQIVSVVQFRGRRVNVNQSTLDSQGLGIGMLGVQDMGI